MVSRNLGFRFTLVSYNILSQALLNEHSYLYTECNQKDLEWPRRGHRIVSELLDNQADIICLQEVECDHLHSLYQPKLARYGYECLYKKKTGYKIDGCAIFFKSKLFHLLNYKGIEFNRTDISNLLNRDNVGIIAVLRPKLNPHNQSQTPHQLQSSQLVVANTHLIFNPNRSDVKLAQLKLLLSELEELSFERYDSVKDERRHHPTILCGDLNSLPESEVSKFITKNQQTNNSIRSDQDNKQDNNNIEPTTTSQRHQDNLIAADNHNRQEIQHCENRDRADSFDELSHSFRFKSVYPTHNKEGRSYVSTFSRSIVDYIFYTPKLKLESYRDLLTEDELRKIGPLPNSEIPSDHLTLWATFRLD